MGRAWAQGLSLNSRASEAWVEREIGWVQVARNLGFSAQLIPLWAGRWGMGCGDIGARLSSCRPAHGSARS